MPRSKPRKRDFVVTLLRREVVDSCAEVHVRATSIEEAKREALNIANTGTTLIRWVPETSETESLTADEVEEVKNAR